MSLRQKIENILKDYRFTDTRIGTNSTFEFSNGNTLPYTGVPFGQNYFSVQTKGKNGAWWFNPNAKNFEGFRLTHQASPWMGDYASILILPFSSTKQIIYNPYYSIFRAGFNLISYISSEEAIVVPTKYGAFINFKAKENAKFNISASELNLKIEDGRIVGKLSELGVSEDKNFTMYIAIEMDKEYKLDKEEKEYIISTNSQNARLKIATSYISIKQAILNLNHMPKNEIQALEKSTQKWDKYLNKFEIKNNREISLYEKYQNYEYDNQIKFFYHCVYRSFLFPMTMYEIDKNNNEIHYDTISKTVKKGKLFTNIGFWDAAKTLFPLFSLVARNEFENILEGILNSYRNSGYLPKWLAPDERGLMPGTLVDNVIAEASSKDIGSEKMHEFLDAMIKSATVDSKNLRYGRAAVDEYNEYGYVPSDFHESVNQTLDNSLSDYSIAQVANKLGKTEIYKDYIKKSRRYLNLFDRTTGFLWEKDRQGNFEKGFNKIRWGSPYTEGSAYQNSYNMYHDIDNFIKEFGGKETFEKRLDELSNSKTEFDVGIYKSVIHEIKEYEQAHFGEIAISNQPSFHIPYLYNHVNRPFKTQLIIKELLLNYFKPNFEGYPGDEDNGSLSAWFIFSSLGIYPLCPGSNQYELGIGLFDEVNIKLDKGNELKIKVEENYHHKKFVKEIKIDGQKYNNTSLDYEKLINAKEIVFELGLVPEI